jgi:hypothetical protein
VTCNFRSITAWNYNAKTEADCCRKASEEDTQSNHHDYLHQRQAKASATSTDDRWNARERILRPLDDSNHQLPSCDSAQQCVIPDDESESGEVEECGDKF